MPWNEDTADWKTYKERGGSSRALRVSKQNISLQLPEDSIFDEMALYFTIALNI